MRRAILTILVAALVAPAATLAAGGPGGQAGLNARAACAALRTQMGPTAFAQAYATFGACVSSKAKVDLQNTAAATAACRTEQADANFAAGHGGKTFDQFYGTNTDLSNAFGKCVSAKAAASLSAQEQAAASAAKACRAELTTDRAAFRTKYGTFGHCVSQKASTK
jgi:hypothetical protein